MSEFRLALLMFVFFAVVAIAAEEYVDRGYMEDVEAEIMDNGK